MTRRWSIATPCSNLRASRAHRFHGKIPHGPWPDCNDSRAVLPRKLGNRVERPRSLAAGPRGDLEPHHRPCERGAGADEVDVPLGATGEALLGALAAPLPPRPIDLLPALGPVRHGEHTL